MSLQEKRFGAREVLILYLTFISIFPATSGIAKDSGQLAMEYAGQEALGL
jgi:hypothetical protein